MNYSTRPDIVDLHTAFHARRPLAREDFGGLDEEQFRWRPAAGKWSIAECLDHLCRVGFLWANHLTPVLFAAMRKGIHHREPHRPGPIGRRAIEMMEKPARPLSSPAPFRPDVSRLERDDVLAAFDHLGESWEAILRRACLLDLSKNFVGSPAAPWMRMPMGTWLLANSAHEDRHLAQARRLLEEPGFGN